MLQCFNSAALNGNKTAFVWFFQTVVAELYRHEADKHLILKYLERFSKSINFLDAVVKNISFNSLFKRLVAVFIKQSFDKTIDKCRLTQLYAETEMVDRNGVLLFPSRSQLDATDQSKKTHRWERSNHTGSIERKRSSLRSGPPKMGKLECV